MLMSKPVVDDLVSDQPAGANRRAPLPNETNDGVRQRRE